MKQLTFWGIWGAAWLGLVGTALADWRDDIGWTRLITEYGMAPATGAGVAVSLTEGPDGFGNYMPLIPGSPGGEYSGKTIVNASGGSNTQSSHANAVGRPFFGNLTSIASGTTNITVYEANDWIENRLNFNSGADPITHAFKVQNHSWAASDPNLGAVQNILQRADFVVNRDEVTMIAATANSGPLPQLLAQSYNVINVGRTDGGHASGLTNLYGSGRSRPDLVAPSPYPGPPYYTSYTTPIVSSVASVLHQAASGTDAARSETMRAILMAGATKEEFGGWDQTASRRIDEVFGAGEVNVYNSYKIVEGGQFTGSLSEPVAGIGQYGWDYISNLDASDARYYDIEIADGFEWRDVSILLAWNMNVTDLDGSTSAFVASTSLANFDLDLFNSNGLFLGSLLDSSRSTLGNVEHLYLSGLGAGRYTLRITTNSPFDYGLAWRANLLAVPEPTTWSLLGLLGLVGALGLVRRRNLRGRLQPVPVRRR